MNKKSLKLSTFSLHSVHACLIKTSAFLCVTLFTSLFSTLDAQTYKGREYDPFTFVKPVCGSNFFIGPSKTGENFNVPDKIKKTLQLAKDRLPQGGCPANPDIFLYPVRNTNYTLRELNGLLTFSKLYDIYRISYVTEDILYLYDFKRKESKFEPFHYDAFRLEEVEPGIINVYDFFFPSQLEERIIKMGAQGLTEAKIEEAIVNLIVEQPLVKTFCITYMNKITDTLITQTLHDNPSVSDKRKYRAPQDCEFFWRVLYNRIY